MRGLVLGLLLALSAWTGAASSGPGTGPPAAESGAALPHHNGATLRCADCHALSGPDRPAGSFRLAGDEINRACLSCHDGVRGIPDVAGEDVNGLHRRSAGRFASAGLTGMGGHTLDGGFTCVSCHDPHGNGNPRNLRLPSELETSPRLGLFTRPGRTGLDSYEGENVAYGCSEGAGLEDVSVLCLDCHTNYRASARRQIGADGAWLLHPSYDGRGGSTNVIAQGESSTDPTAWNLGDARDFAALGRLPFLTPGADGFDKASRVDAGANAVFCLTCHFAHGGEYRNDLRWNHAGGQPVSGCNQCHSQGRRRESGLTAQAR